MRLNELTVVIQSTPLYLTDEKNGTTYSGTS